MDNTLHRQTYRRLCCTTALVCNDNNLSNKSRLVGTIEHA